MGASDATERPGLTDELRTVTRERIVEGAARALAAGGVGVTVDDVAAAAGVSRRTIFRHFPSYDDVIAAAITAIWRRYVERVPTEPPPSDDLIPWLTATFRALYDLNREVLGVAFWSIHLVEGGDYFEELRETVAEAARQRLEWAERFVALAWAARGAPRTPPAWLNHAFLLLGSAFASNGLGVNGLTLEQSVDVAVHTFGGAVDRAIVEATGQADARRRRRSS